MSEVAWGARRAKVDGRGGAGKPAGSRRRVRRRVFSRIMAQLIPGRWRTWWRRQEFDPGPLGWVANPFYFARRGLRDGLAEFFPRLTGEVLDVGCGRKPYQARLPASRYVGLEIDTPRSRAAGVAEVFYDGRTFPFGDESFDGVLCSQVFEHVFNPPEFLAEIRRVLRPGGTLVLAVPFVWDEHEQPHDFGRYSSFGLRAVLERAGFEVEAMRRTMADSRALFQLVNAYLYKVTRSRHRAVNLLAQAALMAPVGLAGVVLGRVLPANPDLFLDNIVLARRAGDAR